MDPERGEADREPGQLCKEKQHGGVTQPKLILQVPEANLILCPLPEEISLAILPSLEHLPRDRENNGMPRKELSRVNLLSLSFLSARAEMLR